VASLFIWCRHQESNSGPTGIIESKSVALCFELIQISDTKKPLIEWLRCLYAAGTKSRTRDLLELSRVSQLHFALN